MAAVLFSLLGMACSEGNHTPSSDDQMMGAMPDPKAHPSPVHMLGQHIFFDKRLSQNGNQACGACHAGSAGWTGPEESVNAAGAVYEGSVPGRFGSRKPPASAYATLAPVFNLDNAAEFVGGNFWDGRATGWKRGSPAADQATAPFLNPLEQALPDAKTLVDLVCRGHYAMMFRRAWGPDACRDVDGAFDKIALSIAAFEGSASVSQFSSKFDAFVAGRAKLDATEQLGLSLFRGKAQCDNCHSSSATAAGPAVFTDFTYDNIGVPRNPENPFYKMDRVIVDGVPINPLGEAFVDEGLGGFLEQLASKDDWRTYPHVTEPIRSKSSAELRVLAAANLGKHRVPTLRNVDRRPGLGAVKAYAHNGYFKSLDSLVHFYNTRDVLPRCAGQATEAEAIAQGCWPAPEVAADVNTAELGDLGLTKAEEEALVAFLRTLSDGFRR